MAASTPDLAARMLLIAALATAAGAARGAAPAVPPDLPISLEAQSSEVDPHNMIFRKVKITQGTMSVAADQAQATGLDFENSQWVFRGAVKISMEGGELTSDQADITFEKKVLVRAVITGKPASFEQRIVKTGRLAQGRADVIDYDVARGVVRLSANAWLSDGQREISGASLTYSVAAFYMMVGLAGAVRAEQTHHLAKSYKSRQILRDLSLEVSSGEVVGLLGPNGAGKTTAFYMMVGLAGCDRGRIELDGRDITRLPMHRRAQLGLGYLPQEPSVFRKLSVSDNIMAILETRPKIDDAGRRARLEELIDELHIDHVRDSLGLSLSGGERRRVEIARALAADPGFILLDEPFAGVDPLSVADIQRIINHLSDKGIGVLITDHNVRETLGICGRAYIVSQGTVIASGTADQILANAQVREVYLGQDFKL